MGRTAAIKGPRGGALLAPDRVRAAGLVWAVLWPLLLAVHLAGQLRIGWTDGGHQPFGEDFLNFWSAARLAITGRVATIYDLDAFHAFQTGVVGGAIDLYHYSYPPTLLLLTAPFALLPYPLAWVAWQAGGWAAFATALRRLVPGVSPLVWLAWPALFVNAVGGQMGAWIAGVVGWALMLLPRRPLAAGLLLSLLAVKPQLAWLVPLALLAGREWRALAGLLIGGTALLALSLLWGTGPWLAYAEQGAMLKRVILEDGSGVWHRMISVFVLLRHAGAPLALAYAVQGVASLGVAAIVLRAWHRGDAARVPLLVAGMLAGAVYVSDYDTVLLAVPAAWAWLRGSRWPVALAALIPIAASPLAHATGLALGTLMLWPLLWTLSRAPRLPTASAPPALRTAPAPRS